MQFVWSDLIHRARVYKDDDHGDEDGWIENSDWLTLFNVEYALLYAKWVRSGLIAPAYTETSFTGNTTTINNVLGIIGVARLEGGRYYPVRPSQADFGRASWFDTVDTGVSVAWEATGAGDNLTLKLYPNDASGTYVVRYITRPAYVTDSSTTVELPYGADERLVLGAADRAGIKDQVVSRKISEKIFESDGALNMLAAARLPQKARRPRVAVVNSDRYAPPFPKDPRFWIYV